MTTLHALHPLSGMLHFHPRAVFAPRQGGILFVRLSDKPLTASQKTELARVLLGQPMKVKKLGDNFTDVEDQSLRQTVWMFSPLRNPGIEKLEDIHLHFAVNEGDEHAILVQHVFEDRDSTVSMENVRRFLQLAAHSTAHIEFGAPPSVLMRSFYLASRRSQSAKLYSKRHLLTMFVLSRAICRLRLQHTVGIADAVIAILLVEEDILREFGANALGFPLFDDESTRMQCGLHLRRSLAHIARFISTSHSETDRNI